MDQSGVLIGSVVNRELESLQGKRISEIAAEQKKDPLDAVFDLILADHGQTGAIYFMMSEDDMAINAHVETKSRDLTDCSSRR